MVKIKELKDVKLEDLVIGVGKVAIGREIASKNVEELTESIKKVGLLQPILVCPSGKKGKYEIIEGHRRVLAHQKLNAKTIKAAILNERVDPNVVCLTCHNMCRNVSRRESIDLCLALYKRYGSVKDVANQTGLPFHKIRKFLKYEILPEPLKRMVDEGTVDLDSAVRATDAASVSGEVDEEEAVTLAKEMCDMSSSQKKRIVKSCKDSPDKPLDEIVEAAKTGEKITQITVTLGAEEHKALQDYATEENTTVEEAITELVTEAMTNTCDE